MPGTFVQSKGGQAGSGTSVNINLTGVAAGNHLTVAEIYNGTATLALASSSPAATWTNAPLSGGAAQNQGTAAQGVVRLDYSENVVSGSWTVTGNRTGGSGITGAVIESTGVSTSSSLGLRSAGGVSTNLNVTPGSFTPTAGSICIGVVDDNGSGSAIDTANTGGQTGNFVPTPAGGASTCWDSANSRGGMFYHDNVSAVATNPTISSSAASVTGSAAHMVEFLASTTFDPTTVPNIDQQFITLGSTAVGF